MAEVPCPSMEVAATVSRVLIRPVSQRQGGKFFALPGTLEELRREVAREFGVSETLTIFNQDRGEIKDVALLRDGDILYYGEKERQHLSTNNSDQSVADALRNIFGGDHQDSVASYSTTVDQARSNVSHLMRSYCQNGPISRRQRASQRRTSRLPFSRPTATPQKKRKVVQGLCYNTVMERPDEPWQYKSFQELWEGNIEYQEQSSVSEILSAICEAYNSSPPVNKPHTSPLTPKQVRFIQRKNGKITTRPSAVYDGQGISCNYRQGCIYIEIMRDEEINPETTSNSSSTSNSDVANACRTPTNTSTASSTTQSSLCDYFSSSVQASSAPSTSQTTDCNQIIDVDGPGPSYMEATTLIVSPELLPSQTCKSEQSKLETLKEMFPGVNDVDVAEILKSSASLEEATNRILDYSHAEEDILNERENEGDAFPLSIVKKDPMAAMDLFRSKILKPELPRQIIRVQRQSPLLVRELFKMMKRGEIDIRRELDIEFVDEDGIDAKGLTREYLNLVLQSMTDGTGGYVLFEGDRDHLLPVHKEEYLQSGYFAYVGKVIALTVVQGGSGLVGLSRAFSRYLVTGDITSSLTELTISDIPDLTVRMCLQEIENAPDDDTLQVLQGRDDIQFLMAQAGFANEFLTLKSKTRAVQHVMLHQVFKLRRDEIDAIRTGLDSVNLTEFLLINESCIPVVFPLTSDISYTTKDVQESITVANETTLTAHEIQVVEWFRAYIDELPECNKQPATVNGTVSETTSELSGLPTLKNVIQFVFGDPFPPEGTKLKLSFRGSHFPDADSCFGILHLPCDHENYSSFKRAMNSCINCQFVGYGRG